MSKKEFSKSDKRAYAIKKSKERLSKNLQKAFDKIDEGRRIEQEGWKECYQLQRKLDREGLKYEKRVIDFSQKHWNSGYDSQEDWEFAMMGRFKLNKSKNKDVVLDTDLESKFTLDEKSEDPKKSNALAGTEVSQDIEDLDANVAEKKYKDDETCFAGWDDEITSSEKKPKERERVRDEYKR